MLGRTNISIFACCTAQLLCCYLTVIYIRNKLCLNQYNVVTNGTAPSPPSVSLCAGRQPALFASSWLSLPKSLSPKGSFTLLKFTHNVLIAATAAHLEDRQRVAVTAAQMDDKQDVLQHNKLPMNVLQTTVTKTHCLPFSARHPSSLSPYRSRN